MFQITYFQLYIICINYFLKKASIFSQISLCVRKTRSDSEEYIAFYQNYVMFFGAFIIIRCMEEILRRLYHINQRNVQRKRIQKALIGQTYILSERKKYDFRQDTAITAPKVNLSFQDEIRFQKQMYQTGQNNLNNLSSFSPRLEQLRLPILSKKQRPKLLRRKFRGAVWAVVFVNRMQLRVKQSLLKRKRRGQKCYKNLLMFIDKLIRGYYERQLKDQLSNYIAILQKFIEMPKMEQDKEITQMLYYISAKLSNSTVTKDILEFLIFSSLNHSFPPPDYLSAMEIARLDFSTKYGCLNEVSQQQTKMMVGLGLGIKVFCYYVLCQPWKLGMATKEVTEKYKQVSQQINSISSVFYFMIMEQFCFKLKEVRSLAKNIISNLSLRPISQLDPFGPSRESNTIRHLIANQSRTYLNDLELKFPEVCNSIKSNLIKWINRISMACLKQSQRKDRKADESVYYKTIDQNKDTLDRKVYKSLQITRKPQNNKKSIKIRPLPGLKYTIQ